MTTFASWEDIGRWYGGLQKNSLDVTPSIQAKADELTQGLKTDDEKIRAIYNFVSLRFHYIGLDFGIGRYQHARGRRCSWEMGTATARTSTPCWHRC